MISQHVLIVMAAVTNIDTTGIHSLEDLLTNLNNRKIQVHHSSLPCRHHIIMWMNDWDDMILHYTHEVRERRDLREWEWCSWRWRTRGHGWCRRWSMQGSWIGWGGSGSSWRRERRSSSAPPASASPLSSLRLIICLSVSLSLSVSLIPSLITHNIHDTLIHAVHTYIHTYIHSYIHTYIPHSYSFQSHPIRSYVCRKRLSPRFILPFKTMGYPPNPSPSLPRTPTPMICRI